MATDDPNPRLLIEEAIQSIEEVIRKGTEAMIVEGLAAQLYVTEAIREGQAYVWWHVMREDIKAQYRKLAAAKIVEFSARNPAPWDSVPTPECE